MLPEEVAEFEGTCVLEEEDVAERIPPEKEDENLEEIFIVPEG